MIAILKWLLALALTVPVAMLGYLLAKDAGRLSIRAWGWQIDTTLVLAIALLLTLAVLLFLLHWLLWRLPQRVLRRRQANLQAQFRFGMEDFLAARFQKAKRRLTQASAVPEHAPMALFFAAQAADALDESQEAQTLLEKAQKFDSVKAAAESLSFDLRLQRGDLSAMQELEMSAANNPIAAKLLAKHLSKRGRAQEALTAIALSGDSAQSKGADWAAMVRLSLAQAPTLDSLNQTWQRLSQAEREQTDVLAGYLFGLIRLKEYSEAWHVLQPIIKKQNTDLLWQALAQIAPHLAQAQMLDALKIAEAQLERSAPEELPNNLLAAAQLCFQLKQNAKAKQLVQRCLAKEESSAAHQLLGEIQLSEGDHLAAAKAFQRALLASSF